jgi:hypothetical protein
MKKLYVYALIFLICTCSGMPVRKAELNPMSLPERGAGTSYLFGSYSYEKKSPDLLGNDIGYLSLLVEPSGNSGENPFYVKMEKEGGGLFVYPIKAGNYRISELLLHYRNEDIDVAKINGYFFSVTNGDIAYAGRIILYISSDTKGYITAGVSPGTPGLPADLSGLGKPALSYSIVTNTNTIFIPRKIYISGLGLMN